MWSFDGQNYEVAVSWPGLPQAGDDYWRSQVSVPICRPPE